ncbi:hypothetical protein SUGI_0204090 [Cryptomeria japonica]|nr:hypothetical protein SUGI_0204090 [Cryptomeria japonica]
MQERRNPVEQFYNTEEHHEKKCSGGRKFSQLAIYVALLTIFSCTNRADADCSLNFTLYPYSPSPSCLNTLNTKTSINVRWRSLEAQPCCMDAKVAFAEALAVKANHSSSSSSIFLDTDEMFPCRDILIQGHSELANCYFDEFTKLGAGFCYNETVDDITKKLGTDFSTLKTVCNGILKYRDNMSSSTTCLDCYADFEDKTRILNNALSNESNVTEDAQDCGLALMIATGSSGVDNYQWIPSLSKCFVYQNLYNETYFDHGKKRANLLPVLGAAGVALVAIVLVLIIYFCLPRKIEKRKAGEGKTKQLGSDGSPLIRFSAQEISNAINYTSPSTFLGEGSTGNVYKGKLPSGQFIAIKHFCKNIPQVDAFEMEIETLSQIRHKNLVSLLGYCDEEGEKYFVYEYCANGNLSQMLLGLQDKVLSWVQRVNIAYDGAPTNILLTESMEAKLAGFGLLRIFNIQETNVFTAVKGTLGYLDPEYASKGRLTSSSDIYGFGIVLLQLLSGRRAIDLDQTHRESLVKKASFLCIPSFFLEIFLNITKMAKKVSQENPIDPSKYADPRLNGEYSREAFVILLKLAVLCTASSSQGRPRMSQVYKEIEKALNVSTSVYV